MQMPRRLVCIVEGKGDVQAIPNLCSRILVHLSAHQWFVDKAPVRRRVMRTMTVRRSGLSRWPPCRDLPVPPPR